MSTMTSNADTQVRANAPAWEEQGFNFGTEGAKGLTVEEALPAAGLDWTVEKVPLYAATPGHAVDNTSELKGHWLTTVKRRFGVQRSDTGEILGTVGETWQPVQNLQGFAILNDVIHQASALDTG